MLQDSLPSVARVVIGETVTLRAPLVVENSGAEPAFDAKVRVASGLDLPAPRGLNCQNQTVNGSASGAGTAGDEAGKVNVVAVEPG